MGSHLCTCNCNQHENWIKHSKPFLRANQGIKVPSELQNHRSRMHGCSLVPGDWGRVFNLTYESASKAIVFITAHLRTIETTDGFGSYFDFFGNSALFPRSGKWQKMGIWPKIQVHFQMWVLALHQAKFFAPRGITTNQLYKWICVWQPSVTVAPCFHISGWIP